MKVIDMHAHLWYVNYRDCKEKIMRTIEHYGVDEVFVSTLYGWRPTPESVELINNTTYDFAAEEPNHIKSYVYISPEHENALSVLRHGVEDKGAVGAKIWVSEYCDSECVNPIAESLIEYGKPLLIHTSTNTTPLPEGLCASGSANVRNLALRYPELKIIMAHTDTNCYRGVQNVFELKNVYVDFSGSTGRSGDLEYTVRHLGAERVLFGTDLSAISFGAPYGRLIESDLTDEQKQMILYKNALKLFYGKEERL